MAAFISSHTHMLRTEALSEFESQYLKSIQAYVSFAHGYPPQGQKQEWMEKYEYFEREAVRSLDSFAQQYRGRVIQYRDLHDLLYEAEQDQSFDDFTPCFEHYFSIENKQITHIFLDDTQVPLVQPIPVTQVIKAKRPLCLLVQYNSQYQPKKVWRIRGINERTLGFIRRALSEQVRHVIDDQTVKSYLEHMREQDKHFLSHLPTYHHFYQIHEQYLEAKEQSCRMEESFINGFVSAQQMMDSHRHVHDLEHAYHTIKNDLYYELIKHIASREAPYWYQKGVLWKAFIHSADQDQGYEQPSSQTSQKEKKQLEGFEEPLDTICEPDPMVMAEVDDGEQEQVPVEEWEPNEIEQDVAMLDPGESLREELGKILGLSTQDSELDYYMSAYIESEVGKRAIHDLAEQTDYGRMILRKYNRLGSPLDITPEEAYKLLHHLGSGQTGITRFLEIQQSLEDFGQNIYEQELTKNAEILRDRLQQTEQVLTIAPREKLLRAADRYIAEVAEDLVYSPMLAKQAIEAFIQQPEGIKPLYTYIFENPEHTEMAQQAKELLYQKGIKDMEQLQSFCHHQPKKFWQVFYPLYPSGTYQGFNQACLHALNK